MKKSFLAFVMAAVLLFSVLASVAAAEEESSAESKIMSLLNMIESSISEEDKEAGKQAAEKIFEKVITQIGEQAGDKAGELDQMVGSLLGGLMGGEGEGDLSAVMGLLGGFMGSEGGEGGDFESLLSSYYESDEYKDQMARDEAIKAHVIDEYKDALMPGDEQIFFDYAFYPENAEQAQGNLQMGFYSLTNYAADGKDLKMVGYASNIELLTLEKNEDGTYTVTEAVQAEEGEKYGESVAAMGAVYGVSLETIESNMTVSDWLALYQLETFMSEHPEYERVEYQGELRTAEELKVLDEEFFVQPSPAAE